MNDADDPTSRCRVAGILRDAGYQIHASASDPNALERTSGSVDLIILGVRPKGGATQLAMNGRVPVLALCDAGAMEADGYLPTPFSARELLDAVALLVVLTRASTLGPQSTSVSAPS